MKQLKTPKRKKRLTDYEAAQKIGKILKKIRNDLEGVQELIKLQKKYSSQFETVYNDLIREAHRLEETVPQEEPMVVVEDDPGGVP